MLIRPFTETEVTRLSKKMAAGAEVGMIKAVVVGGTGAIGRHLVGYLLKHKDKVEKVTVLGRRKVEVCKGNTI